MQACVTVRTREPTEVPKEFDTSFAPTLNASKNAITKAKHSIQERSELSGTMDSSILLALLSLIYDDFQSHLS